ncbi:WD40-repeat-containing domain protein [Sporodiniella umbellata]|nr:WD40-repeat-containing domain protein [Sporodiniella umbellata]
MCLPLSSTSKVVDRLTPMIHKDLISLWKDCYQAAGWAVQTSAIGHYLSTRPLSKPIGHTLSSSLLPRLKPFKAPERIRPESAGWAQVRSSRSQPLIREPPLSQVITERPLPNRPLARRHAKCDDSPLYHYRESTDTRYINWKRLYRNKYLIERRWREGQCKIRQFPSHVGSDLGEHNGGIYCLQFNESILVTGSRDRCLKVWDLRSGALQRTLEGHQGSVLCLQFDARFLISGSSDAALMVWDLATGEPIRTLRGHEESVLNVKFKDDVLVSCSKDRTVRIWHLADDGRAVLRHILRGHRAAVNAVQFKGNRVVSASGDRAIKIWDKNTGECLRTLDSHSRGIACIEFDGHSIVSGSSDQTIRVWNAHTGECVHTLVSHTDLVRTLQLDPHSKRIISGSYDGSLKIWGLDTGSLLNLSQAPLGRILNLQFDLGKIVCCSNLGKIIIYDFAYGIDTQFLA